MQIHAAAFSPDGTIVVLVHGPVVTLWDVESNVLLKVLDAGRQVDKCLFVGDRYLVAAGAGLVVWDLLSCEGKLFYHSVCIYLTISRLVTQGQGRSFNPLQHLFRHDIKHTKEDHNQHIPSLLLSFPDSNHPDCPFESHIHPKRIYRSSPLGRDLPIRSRCHYLRSSYQHHRHHLFQIIINLARDVW
jgi:hypothetical protein